MGGELYLGMRDHFIPARKSDIVGALAGSEMLEPAQRERFRDLCRFLGCVYHYEYYDVLERLRESYFYFSPERAGHARLEAGAGEAAFAEFTAHFDQVLTAANFAEVPHDEIERAHKEHAAVPVETKADLTDFREVRFFFRGRHQETLRRRPWHGFGGKDAAFEVYDNVILFLALKPPQDLEKARGRRGGRLKARPGAVLIKYFRDIAKADLNTLFPNVRVVMSLTDRLMLAVPALAGGVPILLNVVPALSVLLLVIGAWLGISGAVEGDAVKKALAAVSALAALGGFLMRQWTKYERQSLKYQRTITDNIYFRNINNNAGIFDYLIGAAEDQETKEACLAYFFLFTSASPLSAAELDARVEDWLTARFGVGVDFEVDDALAKLARLGILRRGGDGRLSVLGLEDTLARLDAAWDGFFVFPPAPPPARPPEPAPAPA